MRAIPFAALVAVALAGCDESATGASATPSEVDTVDTGGPSPGPPPYPDLCAALTRAGGCGDVLLWAATS